VSSQTLPSALVSVDALDIDAPAAAQLAKDTAPHGHVVHEDGATLIRFDSRDDFRTACENRVIEIENPFLIDVLGANVVVPVLFGWGGQWRWRATATYPAQHACDCGAEVVHQLGCASTEYPDASMFAEAAAIPVVVIDLPRRIPGSRLDAVTPYGDDHRELAEEWRAAVTSGE
jgi:hypothetical protein